MLLRYELRGTFGLRGISFLQVGLADRGCFNFAGIVVRVTHMSSYTVAAVQRSREVLVGCHKEHSGSCPPNPGDTSERER
jgi:hypothetical protein